MGDNEKLWGCLTKLKDLERDGIIDPETAQELMKSKKERILEKFPPKQAGDGGWFVHIRFSPGKNGRKMIKKNNREDLEEAICKFVGDNVKDDLYNNEKCRITYKYKTAFDDWIKAQQYKNKNTELRHQREYRRFFEGLTIGEEMAERDLKQITATQIEQLMTTAIKEFNLTTRKAREDYKMFFKSVFQQAVRERLIKADEDPCLYVLDKRFLKYARIEMEGFAEDRVVNQDTQKTIIEAIQNDHQRKIYFMPAYACELSILTGMRAGELAGLLWKNIDFEHGIINIVTSMKFDEKTKTYYLSDTKNRKNRQFPMTDEILELLNRIQEVQKQYGKTGDFVFSNGKKYSNTRDICNYLQSKRCQYNISPHISIHAERRTLNSKMASQGVSVFARASLFGHVPKVNQMHYTYDMMPIEEKKDIVSHAYRA